MKPLLASLILVFLVGAGSPASQAPAAHGKSLVGGWRINIALSGGGPANLEFHAQTDGKGTFHLEAAEQKTQTVPATWSQTTNDRVNFSGEIEMKFSPCCTETGTLILKGKFKSDDSITGKAIYIGTTENEETFTGYVSTAGTFTATRISATK